MGMANGMTGDASLSLFFFQMRKNSVHNGLAITYPQSTVDSDVIAKDMAMERTREKLRCNIDSDG